MGKRELLFSVTKKDLVIETFRSGGKGGQNQNKVESGVRVRHPASGAVAESREHASQYANKKTAFVRMAKTPEFQKWHKLETSRRLGMTLDIEATVNRQMDPRNLRVEGRKDGRWAPYEGTDEDGDRSAQKPSEDRRVATAEEAPEEELCP